MSVPRRTPLLAWAQLLRLPNLFTAVADPLAGWLVVGGGSPAWRLLPLVGASACLYTGGIVLNDLCDRALDAVERPERPLPRGEISPRAAGLVGAGLLVAGLALAAVAGPFAFGIGVFLAGMILFYNLWAKRFATLAPLTLGVCRAANLLLGMRFAPPALWWMPATLGVYVAALTFVARHEATQPRLRMVVTQLLLGIIVVDAGFVASQGDWLGAALVLSLLLPAVCLGRLLAMT